MRRRPELNRGRRPRAGSRFAAGFCWWCGEPYVLDREAQPWARSQTCSQVCAKRKANLGRHSGNCRHCEMVESFRLAQDSDIRRLDVAAADEDARPVTFCEWLARFEWEAHHDPGAA
jgi:hypothetical protein